jgi:hypothetical protein
MRKNDFHQENRGLLRFYGNGVPIAWAIGSVGRSSVFPDYKLGLDALIGFLQISPKKPRTNGLLAEFRGLLSNNGWT